MKAGDQEVGAAPDRIAYVRRDDPHERLLELATPSGSDSSVANGVCVPEVLVVDDHPLVVDAFRSYFAAGEAVVRGADRPRRIRDVAAESPASFTHAVVDLTYGIRDFDGVAERSEIETGVDAIDFLSNEALPQTRIVVLASLDTELQRELACSIRQAWPAVRFLSKGSSSQRHLARRFVLDGAVGDSSEAADLLSEIVPLTSADLVAALRSVGGRERARRLVFALCGEPAQPRRDDLARHLGVSVEVLRSLVTEVCNALKFIHSIPIDDRGGVGRLWLWSFARRAQLLRAGVASEQWKVAGQSATT